MRSSFDYLEDLLTDHHPIIACDSPLQERPRLLKRIVAYCQSVGEKAYIWNLSDDSIKELTVNTEGNLYLREFDNYKPTRKQNKEDYFLFLNFWKSYSGKGILIVENIFPWLKENNNQETDFFLVSEWIKSSLVNLKLYNQDSGKTTILLGQNAEIASEIAALIPLWMQELPDPPEIIDNLIDSNIFPPTYTDQDRLEIATAGTGLYVSDIISSLKDIGKNHPIGNSSETALLLLSKKIQLLNRLYDIEFLPPPKVQLGGLELMQQSFKKFKRLLTPRAKQYNLRVPKGIMLVGPPGTGKSHSAKACSQNMGIPLIMVDWGNFRSFGNQAEMKLKRLLRLADRLNQVILYFDDFDKGFAGDDDLAKRLAGQLLTWMQERTSDVLVIASVNRMEWLPPELTRAGRFDYLFKVDLPNNGERHTIFKLHAARFDKRFRNGDDPWSEDEWRRILKATNRCVGAEIQTIVERAAASIFCTMTSVDTYTSSELPSLELTIEALLEERRQINPLAIREADRVESMRNKADPTVSKRHLRDSSEPVQRSGSPKIGKKTLDPEQLGVVKNLTPFEDIFHLAGIASISLVGRKDIGALILQKKQDIQIKFCFDVRGIHPSLPEEQILPIFENIEGGLKELPERETLTIHLGSFTDDFLRQQELKKVEDKCDLEQLTLLVRSERLRARELTQLGIRKNKFLRFWCTYSVLASLDSRSNDAIEKAIKQLQNAWFQFTGQIHDVRQERIETILRDSFTSGFQRWEQLVTNSMGLSVRALTASEIWETLWNQFNRCDAPSIPNPLILDEEGLRENQTSDFHIRHLILENEKSVPFLDRSWVRLQDKYIGVLQFSEKPQGWVDEYAQLRYLWEVISKEKIYDTEIICQLSKANQGLAKTALQRITKQSITSSAMSSEKGSIDVKANMNIEEAVRAQETILRGSIPIHTAVVFCVHRKSRSQLDEACQYLSSCFLRPAIVNREIEYAWKTWLQCIPCVWENLLTKPFNRRLPYFSSEVPGLTPLVRTATGDKRGFELIAEEGGTPVHIDLYNQHKNLVVFGTTRAGKSVLVAGLLTPALAQGIPVVALDYPKPDGSSTFTDYTKLMGEEGAYFDISKESNNLFELPDLRGYEPEIIKERITDFKEFLKSTLITMVLGTNPIGVSPTMISNIESIITIALETFFKDDDIKIRYKLAFESGVGTAEWNDIPTLTDFYNYCSPGLIKLDSIANNSQEVLNALDQIRLRLKFWLNSRVGQSISRPSSFKTDARLLVFALRSLSSESDAAILALSAYAAALRRALSSKTSIFFLDEAPILFSFESIAELIGTLCANGAKAGIRVILSAQEPESIFQSKSAPKIFANLTTRLIGRIQTSAVDPFVARFKYPYEIISRNSTEAFFPRRESIYSQWLLDDNGKLTFCRYYPAYCLLAAVANNPNEQELRTLFLNKYAENLMLGMVRFSESYLQMFRGDELSEEAKELLEQGDEKRLKKESEVRSQKQSC